MKKISLWASRHIAIARFYIIIINILLLATACYTGRLLFNMQLLLPYDTISFIAFLLMATAVIFYPVHKKNNYFRQKICDLLLPLSAVLVIVTAVNNADVVSYSNAASGSVILPAPTAQQILNSGKTRKELTHKEKKILKKEFFKELKIYAKAVLDGDKAKSSDALKIILAIIAMLGLFYLLAALVCNLSCSGQDALAVIVTILGTAGIIWGFVSVLKAINRKHKTSTVSN